MGLITPNDYHDLRSLYIGQLRYLLSTENQIVDGLDSMIEHAQDAQLKQAFQTHQQETRGHVDRLNRILDELQGEADIVRESSEGPVRDAGLLATAQKIEHYEMASYGAAREWAETLGLPQHAAELEKTLDEEKHANSLLTQIAQQTNRVAAVA
jgi:ferritin-like metal-binding protein YciE